MPAIKLPTSPRKTLSGNSSGISNEDAPQTDPLPKRSSRSSRSSTHAPSSLAGETNSAEERPATSRKRGKSSGDDSIGKSSPKKSKSSKVRSNSKSKVDAVEPDPAVQNEESEKEDDEDSEVFDVEAITGKRTRKGKVFYQVKWVGFPKSESSWEPVENVSHCQNLIDIYEKGLEQRREKRMSSAKRSKNAPADSEQQEDNEKESSSKEEHLAASEGDDHVAEGENPEDGPMDANGRVERAVASSHSPELKPQPPRVTKIPTVTSDSDKVNDSSVDAAAHLNGQNASASARVGDSKDHSPAVPEDPSSERRNSTKGEPGKERKAPPREASAKLKEKDALKVKTDKSSMIKTISRPKKLTDPKQIDVKVKKSGKKSAKESNGIAYGTVRQVIRKQNVDTSDKETFVDFEDDTLPLAKGIVQVEISKSDASMILELRRLAVKVQKLLGMMKHAEQPDPDVVIKFDGAPAFTKRFPLRVVRRAIPEKLLEYYEMCARIVS